MAGVRASEAAGSATGARLLAGGGGTGGFEGRASAIPGMARGDWIWLACASATIVLITLIPPMVAWALGPPDRVHVGTYWYPLDFSVYLAVMREAASSPSWLVHNHLTAEPHQPALIFPLYVLLGKVAAAAGLPLLAVYRAAEIAMRILLSAALYLFAASLLSARGARWIAFLLAAFSGGIGVWVGFGELAVGVPAAEGQPINTYVEAATFGAFFAAPHIGLGLATLLAALTLFEAAGAGSRPALAWLGASVAGLGLLHPFSLSVLVCATVGYSALRVLAGQPVARWAVACALVIAAAVPLLAYNFVTFSFDPFWSEAYGAQNAMVSPPPWRLPVDYGLVLLLGLLGLAPARGGPPGRAWLLLVWLAALVAWMYVPVPYQRRFALGLHPALAVLAALGYPRARLGAEALLARLGLGPSFRAGVARRVVNYAVVILAFTPTLFVYLAITSSAATNNPIPLYTVDRETYAVGEQLAMLMGPDDVLAGSLSTGNALAGLVPGRVLLGQEGVTPRVRAKRAAIEELFRGTLSTEEIRGYLAANRVSFLVVGPEERKLGPNDPGEQLGLPVAARVGNAVAYAVTREG